MESKEANKNWTVVQYIIENKLSMEEAKEYAKKQGIDLPILSFVRCSEEEADEYEAGQRFVYDSSDPNAPQWI